MKKSPLFIIFLVVFIDLLGFGLVIPILPYYAKQFGASAAQLGLLMGSYSLMQFLFSPFWGRLSDIWGRRPIIIVSVLGTAASMLVVGWANSLTALFLGRIFAGICGANVSTAGAYIADVTKPEDRAKGMGLIGASYGLGFIFGPAFGGILSHYGYGMPALVAAALAGANAVFALLKLEEPPLSQEQRAAHRTKRFDTRTIEAALKRPTTRHVVAVFFLATLAFTQMECCFALFMKERLGFDARQAGWLLAYAGIITVVLQGGLVGKLAKRFGEGRLTTLGTTLTCCALFLMAFTNSLPSVIAVMTILALGQGITTPLLLSLVSQSAPPAERGAVMGVYQSAGSLARVIGPPFAGALFDAYNSQFPFLSAACIMGVATPLALRWFYYGHQRGRHSSGSAQY